MLEKSFVGFVGRVEERDEAALDGFGADDAAFMGIFHVEDEIADVVGGFHHVGERVAGINEAFTVDTGHPALFDDLFEGGNLGVENVVFFAVAFVEGRIRVFQQGCQCGRGQ